MIQSEYILTREYDMEFATLRDEKEIIDLYKAVIEKVNHTEVRLGWNIDIYPNSVFIENAISHG